MDTILDTLNNRFATITIAIAIIAAWQAGRLLGHRLGRKGRVKLSKFDDASIALMGLLIAFAFGTSIAKHDERRLAVVADSNAIGDFYTCAGLLREPTRTELRSIIQQYAQLRLDLPRTRLDNAKLEEALFRFDRLQDQMTQLVGRALADGTPIAVPLANDLNEVSSKQAVRLSAIRDRLPPSIVVLLVASALITALLIGRQQGSTDNYEVAGSLCFVFLVSMAIFVTLDLNQPQQGFVRTSQEPMERLVSSMRVDVNSRALLRPTGPAGSSKADISLPLHKAIAPPQRPR
ncbi:MAG: hypothetical protein ACREQX_19440 [Candidatus Binataceae bacterium]